MLIQQAFSYLSTLVLPIAAPAISEATGLGISLVGVYTAIMYVASTLSAGRLRLLHPRFGGAPGKSGGPRTDGARARLLLAGDGRSSSR